MGSLQKTETSSSSSTSTREKTKKKDRNDGTGEFRVGKPMELGFDLYSMMYVTMLFPEYVYLFSKVHQREEDTLDKLI